MAFFTLTRSRRAGGGSRGLRRTALAAFCACILAPLAARSPDERASELRAPRDLSGVDRASPEFRLIERERRITLLPLRNDTGQASLEFLSEGVVKLLAGRVESIGYVRAPGVRNVFIASPRRGAELDRSRPERFSRSNDGLRDPGETERLHLVVDARRLTEDVYPILQLADRAEQARRLQADYLVAGSLVFADGAGADDSGPESLRQRRRPLTLRFEFFDAVQARRESFALTTNLEQIYRELDPAAERIRSFVLGAGLAQLAVETPEAGAMVYLDELYLGRSPVTAQAPVGGYELRIEQDGRRTVRRRVTLQAGARNAFFIANPVQENRAGLRVTSEPAGATVYLNMDAIGQTPLERRDLPPGAHRIRLEKEGYIERRVGVELRDDETAELSLNMQAGDTLTFYRDPNYLLFDWTRLDFAFYSGVSAFVGYAGYVHFTIRSERILDRTRARLPLLGVWQLTEQFSGGAGPALYGLDLIARDNARSAAELRNARASAGFGVAALIAAIYFAYSGLALDQAKEVGELGWFLREEAHPFESAQPAAQSCVAGVMAREACYQAGLEFAF